ncbi:MAG: hypothetical protein IJ386_07125 [Clostridia bacterium]|nr:hypothetical protein [Clostridia bacterium]
MERLTHQGEHGPHWDKSVFSKHHGMEKDLIIDRLAAYEDTGLEPEQIAELINDFHALMWYGDGCECCAHKIIDERVPFRRIHCGLGNAINCQPRWRGFAREEAEAAMEGGGKDGAD